MFSCKLLVLVIIIIKFLVGRLFKVICCFVKVDIWILVFIIDLLVVDRIRVLLLICVCSLRVLKFVVVVVVFCGIEIGLVFVLKLNLIILLVMDVDFGKFVGMVVLLLVILML